MRINHNGTIAVLTKRFFSKFHDEKDPQHIVMDVYVPQRAVFAAEKLNLNCNLFQIRILSSNIAMSAAACG